MPSHDRFDEDDPGHAGGASDYSQDEPGSQNGHPPELPPKHKAVTHSRNSNSSSRRIRRQSLADNASQMLSRLNRELEEYRTSIPLTECPRFLLQSPPWFSCHPH